MDNKQLVELFDRYMNRESSEEETYELFNYINNPGNANQVTEMLGDRLNCESRDDLLSAYKQENILNQIFEHGTPSVKQAKIRLLKWVKVAAAVLIFILPGLYFFIHNKPEAGTLISRNKAHQKDVQPGGNKATLTLSNGLQIILSNAKNGTLARQGNANIVKLTNGKVVYNKATISTAITEYNTMTTPRGGKYELVLSDGTKVWLNAASSITYPTVFAGKERRVTITGEAYFEVAKNKKMPFKINVNGQEEVQVLGTHFNIMAYNNEPAIKTTLLEGSVRIVKDMTTGTLKPGEQALLSPNGHLSIVDDADIDQAVAWKNGQTLFVNEDIQTIMRQVSRWYDIDIEYQGDMPKRLFTGGISRESNLSALLRILELSKIHFKITDSKIIVTP
ncbi:MAG: FecR family protein [Mucilaginibacter sp.]|nr:FecR family protein [Mucilaginibacter sp.]